MMMMMMMLMLLLLLMMIVFFWCSKKNFHVLLGSVKKIGKEIARKSWVLRIRREAA
jgi:hypothetical protein